MKLLVFAHTPPPHHGQSYMVQLVLEGLGGDCREPRRRENRSVAGAASSLGIECYHVNARLSQKLEEIGDFRVGKLVLLLWYCVQAIWCRFRYGVTNLYYVPAPGKRSAVYRDWVVMLLCRPFFKRLILHWHAAGLAKWLELNVLIRTRSLTYRLMGQPDLSLVLSQYNCGDAQKLFSRQIRVVTNGIPDPCPQFATTVLPHRRARFAARRKLISGQTLSSQEIQAAGGDPHVFKVLYLAHCTHEKGLFDVLAAIPLARQMLAAQHLPLSVHLLVTGLFVNSDEKSEFDRIVAQHPVQQQLEYLGFVAGDQKAKVLREADLFCFPTYYQNENQPVNLIEAMAFGLPILTTRWRSLPDLMPPGYSGLVDIRAPDQIAQTMLSLMNSESGEGFRDVFVRQYTLEQHLAKLAEALHANNADSQTPFDETATQV